MQPNNFKNNLKTIIGIPGYVFFIYILKYFKKILIQLFYA